MLDKPKHVQDLITEARTVYIEWMIARNELTAGKVANALSDLASELDITETAALNLVIGNE